MTQTEHAEELYRAGYDALERGLYQEANRLADKCLKHSAPDSYWHAGALGLICWAATFTGNTSTLEQAAFQLLATDTGGDKPWFDGLAALNLGLAYQREGSFEEAKNMFSKAARSYPQQKLQPGQPPAWQYVLDYFGTLSAWLENGDSTRWQQYTERMEAACDPANTLCRQLLAAANLMSRYTKGEKVSQEAAKLLERGVSRTFLCAPLLNLP